MTKPKAKRDREPGVYLRMDGRPRFEFKVRWTNPDGSKSYTPTRIFPFDPAAKGGPTCRAHALDSANRLAIDERAALRLHDKPRAQLAEAWTLGGLLERLIEEQTALKAEAEEADKATGAKTDTKAVRQKISYARMMLGLSSSQHTKNLGGFPDLCRRPIRSLTPAHFSGTDEPNALASRLKGKDGKQAPGDSIRRVIGFLSWTFQHAKTAWKIDCANPLEKWAVLDLPPTDKGRERTLTTDEWAKVEKALEASWPVTQIAVLTARFTAARRGEVVKLEWEDLSLDSKNATALLRNTKSKHKNKKGAAPKNRSIPIPALVAKRLLELRESVGGIKATGAVFIGQKGTRMGADSITQAWNRASARAGVKGARLHDLRHTRITEIGNLLKNPLQVAAISGHEDLSVLKRYFNASAEELGAVLEELEVEKTRKHKHRAKGATGLDEAITALAPLTSAQMFEAVARAQALQLQKKKS